MRQGNSGKLCRTTCLPSIAILEVRFSTLIFASCQSQSPSAGAVIKDGSDTYQRCHSPYTSAITCTHWHILKCAHVPARAHKHTHTQTCHPYVHATCPFLTSDPDILPDELIHLASVHGRWKNIKLHGTIARYHQHSGRELVGRHIQLLILLIFL